MNGSDITLVPKMQETWEDYCAYCRRGIAEVEHTIHRDGVGEGPEVPLCEFCAKNNYPTLDMIWARISDPDPMVHAIREALGK